MNRVADLHHLNPRVHAWAVVDADGALRTWWGPDALEGAASPLTTALVGVAERALDELAQGDLEAFVLRGSEGTVVARRLDDDLLGVVIAETTVSLGLLLDDLANWTPRLHDGEVAHG